jgi:hypothetical protein
METDEDAKRVEAETQVKRVEGAWNSFIWKYLDIMTQLEIERDYAKAFEVLLRVCNSIPDEIYKDLQEDLDAAEQKFLRPINAPPEPFLHNIVTNKVKQRWAEQLVFKLHRKLVSLLDRKGYIARRTPAVLMGYEKGL